MEAALQFVASNGSLTSGDAASLLDHWPELFSLLNASLPVCSEPWPECESPELDPDELEQLHVGMLYMLGLRQLNNTTLTLPATPDGTAPTMRSQRRLGANHNLLHSLNYTGLQFYVVALFLIALSIWTAIGSLLVDLSIIRFRSLRTVPNILVGNLSLSDFLLALTILPMSVVNDLLGHWVFGRLLCYVWLVGDVLYCTSSIWSLCIIAFDRFTATVFPIWYRDQRSPQRAVLYIVANWALAVIIIIPPMTGWMKLSDCYLEDRDHPGMMQCQLFTDEAYVVYSSMGSFIVPLLVMCILYGKIFAVLWKRAKMSKKETMMRKRHKTDVAVTPVVAFSGKIRYKHVNDAEVTQTNASIQATVTINPAGVDSDNRTAAGGEKQVLRIKLDNTVKIATISSRCLAGQSQSMSENTVSDSKCQSESHASRKKLSRGISFQTSWNRRRKSSGSQGESESNEVLEDTETTVTSRPICKPVRVRTRTLSQRRKLATSKSLHRRETQATLRAMLIIIIFILCWIPFTVMYVVGGFLKDQFEMNPHVVRFIIWLGYANSAINPLLIFCYNKDFRAAFKAIAYGVLCGLARRGIKTRDSVSRFEQYRRQKRKGAVCSA